MLVGDSRLLNIRVIKDNEIIYEGMVEDAPYEIKEMNTIDKCNFDNGILVMYV